MEGWQMMAQVLLGLPGAIGGLWATGESIRLRRKWQRMTTPGRYHVSNWAPGSYNVVGPVSETRVETGIGDLVRGHLSMGRHRRTGSQSSLFGNVTEAS